MRRDLLGHITDARAQMILRGHPARSLFLSIGETTRDQLVQDLAPFPAFGADPDRPEILDMPVLSIAGGEGFVVMSVDRPTPIKSF